MTKDIFDFKNCKSIAIMGGTFDPIHYGHLATANVVRQEFNIQKVIFIPTGTPPHKEKNNISSAEHRYLMTVLATLDNSDFDVSKIEINREGVTYTIDTIEFIRSVVPEDTKIYFITGADAISKVSTWKNSEKLFELCEFIAVTRPNYIISSEVKQSLQKFENKIHFLEVPALAISSSDIRNRVKTERTISYLLPKGVEEYIYKFNLYRENQYLSKYKQIIEILKENLNISRFNHSLEVAEEAISLARKYNVNEEDAFLAGVLHDCAKCFDPDKKIELCKKYNIELDEVMLSQIDLTHSFLGYFVARDDYKITDENILNSIKYHTTGKANMTDLEKIIYIADYIEPTRKPFEHQAKARELAYTNLDEAMYFILESTIHRNLQRNRLIHNLSEVALDFYEKKEIK